MLAIQIQFMLQKKLMHLINGNEVKIYTNITKFTSVISATKINVYNIENASITCNTLMMSIFCKMTSLPTIELHFYINVLITPGMTSICQC